MQEQSNDCITTLYIIFTINILHFCFKILKREHTCVFACRSPLTISYIYFTSQSAFVQINTKVCVKYVINPNVQSVIHSFFFNHIGNTAVFWRIEMYATTYNVVISSVKYISYVFTGLAFAKPPIHVKDRKTASPP